MMQLIDRLNQERHKVSSLGALGLVLVVFLLAQALRGPAELVAQEAMELTTALIEPMLQPPPPPAPQPPKPEAKPKSVPTVTQTQAPAPAPTEVRREVAATETPKAVAPITPAPLPVAAPQETPKPAPPVSASLESNYIASVRATLNANKRYPTGREASLQRPAGKVKVWFVLTRNGALQEAGIDESSNSIILDNAALTTVRRTTYAPWPDGSWANEAQHKFTVTLDFVPLS